MYVLDTNILAPPSGAGPDRSLLNAWLLKHAAYCYLSAATVTELSFGVSWLRHKRATKRAASLADWLETLMSSCGDRVLPVTTQVAHRAGMLLATARAAGVEVDTEDAWIGACADLRRMTVLTFNDRHFAPMGIAHINPDAGLPEHRP
jgi:predicted nucleic acid-binding protein